jgi:hypothetical protein
VDSVVLIYLPFMNTWVHSWFLCGFCAANLPPLHEHMGSLLVFMLILCCYSIYPSPTPGFTPSFYVDSVLLIYLPFRTSGFTPSFYVDSVLLIYLPFMNTWVHSWFLCGFCAANLHTLHEHLGSLLVFMWILCC